MDGLAATPVPSLHGTAAGVRYVIVNGIAVIREERLFVMRCRGERYGAP